MHRYTISCSDWSFSTVDCELRRLACAESVRCMQPSLSPSDKRRCLEKKRDQRERTWSATKDDGSKMTKRAFPPCFLSGEKDKEVSQPQCRGASRKAWCCRHSSKHCQDFTSWVLFAEIKWTRSGGGRDPNFSPFFSGRKMWWSIKANPLCYMNTAVDLLKVKICNTALRSQRGRTSCYDCCMHNPQLLVISPHILLYIVYMDEPIIPKAPSTKYEMHHHFFLSFSISLYIHCSFLLSSFLFLFAKIHWPF